MSRMTLNPTQPSAPAPATTGRAPRQRGLAVHLLARLSSLAITAQLVACAAPPPVRFHTLMPAGPHAANTSAGELVAVLVSLSPIGLPAQVDQPQWLVRLPDDTMTLLEQDRWAGPLRDELRHALLEALIARWGAVDARTAAPAPTTGQAPAWRVVWQVTVDVARFESSPGLEARLDSRWSASTGQPGTPSLSCSAVLREPVPDGMPALAQGHRLAATRLADQIGRALQALQRGQATSCSSPAAGLELSQAGIPIRAPQPRP